MEINHPTQMSVVTAPTVIVSITVRSFHVVDKIGQNAKAGEGHVVYSMDDRSQSVAATSFRWENVKAGKHRFGVRLVNNDGTRLEKPATDDIVVTVQRP